MSNRIPATFRDLSMSTQLGQPSNNVASNVQDQRQDYSLDELKAMPFPPCSTAEYAELRHSLFRNGHLVCHHNPAKAGALALQFLRENRIAVLRWLAAHTDSFNINIPANDGDPFLLKRISEWMETGAQGCNIELRFASLSAFEHVASVAPWSYLAIEGYCSSMDVTRNIGANRAPGTASSLPGPKSLELKYQGLDGVQTFSHLVQARSASAKLRLNLDDQIGEPIAVELITALLRSNSLHQLFLFSDSNMTSQIFQALRANVASAFRSMRLLMGSIDADAGQHFGAFLAEARHLEELHIINVDAVNATPGLISGLESNTSLRSLQMAYTELRAGTTRQLAVALARNPHLEKLAIFGQCIDGDGAKEFASSFCEHDGLHELRLDLIFPKHDPDSEAVGMAMASMVRKNPRLRVLYLSVKDGFEGEGHRQFIKAALESHTLWEVGYDFPDQQGANTYFNGNWQRHLNLARAGFTLASLGSQLPPELEDVIIDIMKRLAKENRSALNGLAGFAEEVLKPGLSPALDSLA